MSRALGLRDPWTEALFGVAVLGAGAGGLGMLTWAAGRGCSLLTGHGAGPRPVEAARRFAAGGVASVWPGVPVPLIAFVTTSLALVLIGVAFWGLGRWQARRPARDGFASASAFTELTGGRDGTAKARRLRPSLALTGSLADRDRGVPLGRLVRGGRFLRASWEDVLLVICPPRIGKTSCLAVPSVLDAPGAVLATSNKADLWELTTLVRAAATGEKVWTFDPQHITRGEQGFTWNALAGVASVADARRLAGHFIQEIRRGADSGDFWDRDAEDLLTGLLLAAAISGKPLSQVGSWLTSISSVQPRNILAAAGFGQLSDAMTGRSQGAVETREGVYASARAAAACLSDPAIMSWVEPRPGLPAFDPVAFAYSRQTLYLLSKDGAGSAAPLVAAFADRVMLEAIRAAETSPGGRLDPPMIAVLDEAANVCRISELPRLYSHLGSRGVVPLTILQSRSQGQRVWGRAGMDELWGASTVKLIGTGTDEPALLEDLSKMVGERDVVVTTRSSGKTGGTSRTTRRDRVLPPDRVRAMPRFTALLLVTSARPALLRLVPWMNGPHAGAIRDGNR